MVFWNCRCSSGSTLYLDNIFVSHDIHYEDSIQSAVSHTHPGVWCFCNWRCSLGSSFYCYADINKWKSINEILGNFVFIFYKNSSYIEHMDSKVYQSRWLCCSAKPMVMRRKRDSLCTFSGNLVGFYTQDFCCRIWDLKGHHASGAWLSKVQGFCEELFLEKSLNFCYVYIGIYLLVFICTYICTYLNYWIYFLTISPISLNTHVRIKLCEL